MSKLGNSASVFSVPSTMAMPVTGSGNATSSPLTSADLSADSMAGTVVGGAVAVLLVAVAVALTICLRLRRRPSDRPRPGDVPDLVISDEESGLSKQIVEIEQFRLLHVPLNDSTFSSSYTTSQDSTYFRSSDRTFERSSDSFSDSFCDTSDSRSSEAESSTSWSYYQSEGGNLEESGLKTWWLDSVHRLEVIEEESEEVSCNTTNTDSPQSTRSAGSVVYSNDDLPSFQSCSDGGSDSVLDMAFSESTNTNYKTCSENTSIFNTAFSKCSNSGYDTCSVSTSIFDTSCSQITNTEYETCSERTNILNTVLSKSKNAEYKTCKETTPQVRDEAYHEGTNTEDRPCSRTPRPEHSDDREARDDEDPCPGHPVVPRHTSSPDSSASSRRSWHSSEHSPSSDSHSSDSHSSGTDRASDDSHSSGTDRASDDSHSSGTSGEVSSGCFDLSYVTFHTLPDSSTEDGGLQALYACFDPRVRAEAAMSKHASRRSSLFSASAFSSVRAD